MSLFNKLFKKEEGVNEIVAPVTGVLIPANQINDPVFAKEMMGKTVGIKMEEGTIVSPVSGSIEVLFPTGHAFCVKMDDDSVILVHIGIDTVKMNGKGFKVLKKAGDKIKAGEPVIEVDLEKVKEAGYDPVTMLIFTELSSSKDAKFICGPVKAGEFISKIEKK